MADTRDEPFPPTRSAALAAQAAHPSRSSQLVSHFDQILIGVVEVDRVQRPTGPRSARWALDYAHSAGSQVLEDGPERDRSDEAEIGGAGSRVPHIGIHRPADLMKIELLMPEVQSCAAFLELPRLHPEHAFVKRDGRRDAPDRQHHVVKAINVHGASR